MGLLAKVLSAIVVVRAYLAWLFCWTWLELKILTNDVELENLVVSSRLVFLFAIADRTEPDTIDHQARHFQPGS